MGEMWQQQHFKITKMTERGAVIVSEINDKPIIIRDLNDVMQFEIDGPFQTFEPHTHYSIDPTLIHQSTRSIEK
jgi:hypothetical protein